MPDVRIPLTLLASWRRTAADTLDQEVILAPADGNGQLVEGLWVAEVAFVEVLTSTTPIAPADLQDLQLRLDGRGAYSHLRWNGREDASTALRHQPNRLEQDGKRYVFHTTGLPITQCPNLPGTEDRDPRYCTMPKFIRSIGLQYVARAAIAINVERQFNVYGYMYPADRIASWAGYVGGGFPIIDTMRGRSLSVPYPRRLAAPENWTKLPGGLDQGTPAIHRYLRDSVNLLATTAGQPYQFRLEGGFISRENQELFWKHQTDPNALWIQHIGVRATSANMRFLVMRLGDEEFPAPRGQTGTLRGWPVRRQYNPQFHYGHEFPEGPEDGLRYFPLPRLDKEFLVYREIGQVNVIDNGAAIPIGGVRVAVSGLMIEGV